MNRLQELTEKLEQQYAEYKDSFQEEYNIICDILGNTKRTKKFFIYNTYLPQMNEFDRELFKKEYLRK